jgi:FtsX-like permease family
MGAIAVVMRGQFRQRWPSWLVLALLVGLVSGLAMAAAVAARRTESAFPRFLAAHGYDAVLYTDAPLPGLARAPQVASVTPVGSVPNGPVTCSCTHPVGSNFALLEVPAPSLGQVTKLVAGRRPRPSAAGEVLASDTLAQDKGVRVGSVFHVRLYGRQQGAALAQGGNEPARGPQVTLRVVGLEAAENEFPSGQQPNYYLYTTPAFAAAANSRALPFTIYYVRLRHGPASLPGFDAGIRHLEQQTRQQVIIVHLAGGAAAVQASIRPQAAGWWVLAGIAALAGLVVVGQAVARQTAAASTDNPALVALGMAPRELALLAVARAFVAGVAGAAAAVALAAALSGLTPLGEARLAEPSVGWVADGLILPLGALVTVTAVVLLAVRPARRGARLAPATPPARPGPAWAGLGLAALGAPPSAVIGIRHALERGRETNPVPAWTALAGTILAVAALAATAVFGASLSHLIASPELYGDPFPVMFTSSGGAQDAQTITGRLLRELTRDPSIDQVTQVAVPEIAVNHVQVRALALRPVHGPPLLSTITGRVPAGDRQISLGPATMRQTRAHVGSLVQVTVTTPAGGTRTASFRVVGQASFPSDFGTGGLGMGAALTLSAYLGAQCPAEPVRPACLSQAGQGLEYALLAHAVPGAAGRAALARHVRRYPGLASRPTVPTALVNFGVSVNFPVLIGALLALFGVATMVHLLLVSVGRRRREAGLLKVLGFLRYQVAAVVSWQATAVAVVGLIAGLPLGIAAGRVLWRVFATSLGAVPVPVVPFGLLAVLAAGALIAANVLAFGPALVAGRTSPGDLLRTL